MVGSDDGTICSMNDDRLPHVARMLDNANARREKVFDRALKLTGYRTDAGVYGIICKINEE